MIKIVQWAKVSILESKGKIKHKEEPNGYFRTEIYNNQNKKTEWISFSAEHRGQNKETVNWKTEEQKLFNMNNKEKTVNRGFGTYGSVIKDLMSVSLESKRKGQREKERKSTRINHGWKPPKCVKKT